MYTDVSASPVVLVAKNPPANAGDVKGVTLIPGLGRSPGGEGMATHLGILAWKTPQTEEPGWLWPIGSQRVKRRPKQLSTHPY